jgi:NADH-quinone oxidoreductase subunit C
MAMPTTGDARLDTAKLQAQFGDDILSVTERLGETYVCVNRDQIAKIHEFLKNDPELSYDYFVECVGVDYGAWNHDRDFIERFEVVYNLYSVKHASRLFIKVGVNDGQKVPTVKNVFLGAEYPEREVWDLLGVVFEGNEQEERFLLPEDWVGFPLRKDEPLGGEDVHFHDGASGPAVEDLQQPHAGESFEGTTGSEGVSGR